MIYIKLFEEFNNKHFLTLYSKSDIKNINIFIDDELYHMETYDIFFKGENNALVRGTFQSYFYSVIDDVYKPFRYIEIARIDAPSQDDSFYKRIERKGYGTIMLNEIINYCKDNDIDYIGSCSLNEMSRGLFEKFENNNIISPVEYGFNKKTILWKII